MKNILIYAFMVGVVIASCNSNSPVGTKNLIVASDTASIKYQCPMKCQGDTAYTAFGQCPVCEMDLVKLND